MALDVVRFEHAADAGTALVRQVAGQHQAPVVVGVQDKVGFRQVGVVAVDKHEGDIFRRQLPVQVQVRVGQRTLGGLHQNAVHRLLQQAGKNLPLVGHPVLGSEDGGGTLLPAQHILYLPQNAGENVVADIGDNDSNIIVAGGGLGGAENVGAAAPFGLNQSETGILLPIPSQ